MADAVNTPDTPLASYDYTELRDGFGLETYNLYAAIDSSGTDYVIGKETPYSAEPVLEGPKTATTTTYTCYTGTFSSPRVLLGTMFCSFGMKLVKGGGVDGYCTIKVYHYDGSTSTQVGSTWTSATQNPSTTTDYKSINAIIPITSSTTFKKGDQIKMEIAMISNSTNDDFEIGCDPQNRAGGVIDPVANAAVGETTVFTLLIPFRNYNQ